MTETEKITAYLNDCTEHCAHCGGMNCKGVDQYYMMLNLCRKLLDACEYYATNDAFEESKYIAISSNFKSNNAARKALQECADLL